MKINIITILNILIMKHIYQNYYTNDNINIYNNFDFLKYSFTVIKE